MKKKDIKEKSVFDKLSGYKYFLVEQNWSETAYGTVSVVVKAKSKEEAEEIFRKKCDLFNFDLEADDYDNFEWGGREIEETNYKSLPKKLRKNIIK
jgi:hypothetical protein